MAGILLILRGMHTGVIRDRDHETAVDAGVSGGIERVGRDIQADVLHRRKCSCTCEGCAQCGLNGDLFIRCPFRIDFVVLRNCFGDLCRGRAGIAGRKPAAGLIESAREGFIAKHQFFHIITPSL